MGCYFLLVEEELQIRPTHGFMVCGDGTRHRIENDERLRAWVLDLAGQIRAARAAVTVPIPVDPKPSQCRPCGMRGHCGQGRGFESAEAVTGGTAPTVKYDRT